ncbi:MAG: orotidine 5'-phosphate decarboxylase [Candidatus Bathyarchaeota archaeon]
MFYEKYLQATKQKGSFINLNLDPALPNQRSSNTIPESYANKEDRQTLLDFSLDIIEQVSDYCCCVKPNTQYYLGHTGILQTITKKIHEHGMISILDHKLTDIGSTNGSALYWIQKMGFDAFTFSPFAGNISRTVQKAHEKDLGVIVLTLMYADGCVVGLTCFVKPEYVKKIQQTVGDKAVFLLQGIGPQGGKANNIRHVKNPLISLGRAVLYTDNPKKTIQKYHEIFKKYT